MFTISVDHCNFRFLPTYMSAIYQLNNSHRACSPLETCPSPSPRSLSPPSSPSPAPVVVYNDFLPNCEVHLVTLCIEFRLLNDFLALDDNQRKLASLKLEDIDRRLLADADDIREALEAEYQFYEQRRHNMLSKVDECEVRMDELQAELRNVEFHFRRFKHSVDQGCTSNMLWKTSGVATSCGNGLSF